MSPLLAASLSLVPGVGHWVIGKRGKAAALFAVDLGIACSVFFLRSSISLVLTCLVYFLVMVPAVIETYTLARGGRSQLSESKPYIVLLLLATGFSALPLLWQSHSFSKRIKIVWSIAVPVLAVLFWMCISLYGMQFTK